VNEVKGIYAGLVMVEKKCVEPPADPKVRNASMQVYWASIDETSEPVRANLRRLDSTTRDAAFADSDDAAAYACRYLGEVVSIVAQRIEDKNVWPISLDSHSFQMRFYTLRAVFPGRTSLFSLTH
jgi:hypothetical protein